MWAYLGSCTQLYIQYIQKHTHIYMTYMHIHSYIHTYIHTYAHTHIHNPGMRGTLPWSPTAVSRMTTNTSFQVSLSCIYIYIYKRMCMRARFKQTLPCVHSLGCRKSSMFSSLREYSVETWIFGWMTPGPSRWLWPFNVRCIQMLVVCPSVGLSRVQSHAALTCM
jgi:hypothetical protein